MENNGADCGLILLADAEIALDKVTLDDLSQESSHLRLRYLAALLTPGRANIYGRNDVEKL
jgi:DNA helicase TIP49 (TBP-interacting protein)